MDKRDMELGIKMTDNYRNVDESKYPMTYQNMKIKL